MRSGNMINEMAVWERTAGEVEEMTTLPRVISERDEWLQGTKINV